MKAKQTSVAVTAFGVATAAMYISPSAEATIVDLTPGNFPQTNFFGDISSFDFGIGDALVVDFAQWNDSSGRTAVAGTDLQGIALASASSIVDAGFGFTLQVGFGTSTTGTEFIAFLTEDNNVGWLQLSFDGPGSDITYLAAAFEDSGNPIHVGSLDPVDVPEPSTLGLAALGLLAAGAAGKRRKAKRRTAV